MSKFNLIPVDVNPVHDELVNKLADYLTDSDSGYSDITSRQGAVSLIKIFNKVLEAHNLEVHFKKE